MKTRNIIAAIKAVSPEPLKRALRVLLIVPIRLYFRFFPSRFLKKSLWNGVLEHLWWLETDVNAKVAYGSVLTVNPREGLGRCMYYFGKWEPNLSQWLSKRLGPNDVFVDIGANVGYFSLLASRLVGSGGKVVAIEALPEIYGLLRGNIEKNAATNVRAVNLAVWDSNAELKIFTHPNNHVGCTTVMKAWAGRWGLEEFSKVRAVPLPGILENAEAGRVRLIKIDVEGAEWHVLKGLESMLSGCRQDLEIIVEVTPVALAAEGKSWRDIFGFFERYAFHPYVIPNDYSVDAYLRPTRLDKLQRALELKADEQCDLVFSKIDAPCL